MIMLDFKESNRYYNNDNHLIIKNNPIAKSGVFDYFREDVDSDTKGTPAGRDIVKVYRPFEELSKAIDTFKNAGVTLEHKWLNPEALPHIVGSLGTNITQKEPYLYVDLITIYDKEAIDCINNGTARELSPGYNCIPIKENGIFGVGEAYEYKQTAIQFNHLALVDEGRSGKDLKILDKGKEIIMSKTIKVKNKLQKFIDNMINKDEDIDKREIIRELLAVANKQNSDFVGGENEKFDEILKLAEKVAYNKSEDEDIDKREKIRELLAIATKPDSDFQNENEKFDLLLKLLENISYDDDTNETNDENAHVISKDKNEKTIKDDIDSLKFAFAEFAKMFQEFLNEEKKEKEHNENEAVEIEIDNKDSENENENEVKALDFNNIKEQLKSEIKADQQKILKAFLDVKPFVGDFNYENKTETEIYDYALRIVNPNIVKVSDSKSAFKASISMIKTKENKTKTIDSNSQSKILDMIKNIK